jgi:hypothetical protein
MTDSDRMREPALPECLAWSFDDHRRRQTRRGLEMTPAERLRWLEETMDELREIQGRAAVRRSPAQDDRGRV